MEEILAKRAQENNKDLYAALAKAQSEMDMAGKTSANPFFKSKYADFTEIVRASRPALTKHGLSVIQKTQQDDQGRIILITKLCHSSGQYEESIFPIPSLTDLQKLGSALSYAKRYSYAAIVGVVVGEEDDDGETAVMEVRHSRVETFSKDQQDLLQSYLQDHPDIATTILNSFKVNYISQLPADKFNAITKRALELIKAKESR